MYDFENSKGAIRFDLLQKFAEESRFEQRLGLAIPLMFLTQREMTEQELWGILKVLNIDLLDDTQLNYTRGMFSALQASGILRIIDLLEHSLIDTTDPSYMEALIDSEDVWGSYLLELEKEAESIKPFFSD